MGPVDNILRNDIDISFCTVWNFLMSWVIETLQLCSSSQISSRRFCKINEEVKAESCSFKISFATASSPMEWWANGSQTHPNLIRNLPKYLYFHGVSKKVPSWNFHWTNLWQFEQFLAVWKQFVPLGCLYNPWTILNCFRQIWTVFELLLTLCRLFNDNLDHFGPNCVK